MTKIVFNDAATKGANEVIDFSSNAARRVVTRAERIIHPDRFSSDTKIVTPFYNRFLPQKFCRYKEVTFYPNTKVIKHMDTYNSEGEVIRSKSFNETGILTFDEKINPRTGNTKTMLRSNGKLIEQEMQGSVLLKKQVRDYEGKITYSYEFDPQNEKEVITEIRDEVTYFTKKVKGEEVYKLVKSPNGDITQTGKNKRLGISYCSEGGIVKYADGKKSDNPKFKRLTIKEDNLNKSTVYELVPDEHRYSCKVYDDLDTQIGETKYIHSESMKTILDRVYGLY